MESGSHPRAALTEGPVLPALRGLALPMALGIVFIIAVNLIDTYYVGQLGLEPLAAMSFTFPIVNGVMSVAMGLSVGATSAIARAIGNGDDAVVRRLTTHALLLALLVVATVSGLGVLTQVPVLRALGAAPELIPLVTDYMTIWFAGAIFLVVPIVANGALRANGDARTPMVMMMIAAVMNLILDPLFIFGWGPIPRLELQGAAIATLIARSVTLLVALGALARSRMLDLHLPTPGELLDSWRKVVSVGAPAALTNAMGPAAAALLTALVAREGASAVAAYGVGARVDSMLLIPPMALTSALSPFIGQNWGAHLLGRVREAAELAIRFSILWGLSVLAILVFAAPALARLFSDDPAVQEPLTLYLRLMPLGYAAYGVVSAANASFNAVDRAVRATLISAARSLLLAVPFAWVGQLIWGLGGVFGGLVLANVVAAAVASWWVRALFDEEAELDAEPAASPVTAPAAATERFDAAVRGRICALIEEIGGLEAVEVRRSRGDTLAFFVGRRELGHLHRGGHMDLPLPPELGEHLARRGRVEPHRSVHGGAWYTHALQGCADLQEARWLLRLSHALYEIRRRGPEHEITRQELAALELDEETAAVVMRVGMRCRAARARAEASPTS